MRDRNNFDLIRFLAAVTVIYSHCYPLVEGMVNDEPLLLFTKGTLTFATAAVYVFFIISGYLISMSWEKSSSWSAYLQKRLARIVPGYVCAMLFGVFIVAPFFGGRLTSHVLWLAFKAMCHLREVSVPGVFAGNPLSGIMNGSAWTVSVEFKCYLGLMMIAIVGRLRPLWIAVCAVLCSFYFRSQHVPYFAAGVIFQVFHKNIPMTNAAALVSSIALIASLFSPLILQFALPIFGAHLLFWCAFQPYAQTHRFAKYGDFSYGIYLYAFPVQQMLLATWPHTFTPVTLFFAATPLAILCGIISWRGVERHFLGRRRHVTDIGNNAPSSAAKSKPSTATA